MADAKTIIKAIIDESNTRATQISGVQDTINKALTPLQTQLTQEITDRTNGDTNLEGEITTLKTTLEGEINSVKSALETEISDIKKTLAYNRGWMVYFEATGGDPRLNAVCEAIRTFLNRVTDPTYNLKDFKAIGDAFANYWGTRDPNAEIGYGEPSYSMYPSSDREQATANEFHRLAQGWTDFGWTWPSVGTGYVTLELK